MIYKLIISAVFMAFTVIFAGLSSVAAPLYSEGHKPGSAKDDKTTEEVLPDVSNLIPYIRIGVMPFEQITRSETGAKKFLPILIGRLENQRKETEFIKLDIELDSDTPLMGETARKLGEEYGLDAILIGSFAIEIIGGIYPSKTNNTPVGKISVECRVIECKSGWSRGKMLMTWDKNHIYPQTIRSQKELEGRLMRDGVDDTIKMLLERGLLSFEAPLESPDAEDSETE